MKKIFLIILTLPLVSLAQSDASEDPNLVFQSGCATATSLGTSPKPACPMCVHKVLRGANTNALPGAPKNTNPTQPGAVDTGI